MKSKRCIFIICALLIFSFNFSSCLLSGIISSDTIDTEVRPQLQQQQQQQQQEKTGQAIEEHAKIHDSDIESVELVKSDGGSEHVVQIENDKQILNKDEHFQQNEDKIKVENVGSEKLIEKPFSDLNGDNLKEHIDFNSDKSVPSATETSSSLSSTLSLSSSESLETADTSPNVVNDVPNVPETTTILRDTSDQLHLESRIDDDVRNGFNVINNTQTNEVNDSLVGVRHAKSNKKHSRKNENESDTVTAYVQNVIQLPDLHFTKPTETETVEVQSDSVPSAEDKLSHEDEFPTATTASSDLNASDAAAATTTTTNDTESVTETTEKPIIELNLTVEENQIPVFSEWAEKRLKEAEQEVEQDVVNSSVQRKNTSAPYKPPVVKLKTAKNYASPDCGAKIIAANSESSGTGHILTSNKDEYLLSPCKSRIWFIVELCETIQAERIELANFELFSSSPKNFSVGVSSRFPTRDWSNVGRFIAKDERYVQNFDLFPQLFGKYVRVDIHSHYNSEHFCPISLFRVYGTSEFEAFETENRQHPIDELDDDEADDEIDDSTKPRSNIFKSASDAVMSIVDTVKKAASFVKPNDNKTNTSDNSSALQLYSIHNNCITPNHAITCEKCSKNLTMQVEMLIRCKPQLLNSLLSIELIRNSIYKSQICANLVGLDLHFSCREQFEKNVNLAKSQLTEIHKDYIMHLFPISYMVAMCNLVAGMDRRFTFNASYSLPAIPPVNVTIDKKPILMLDHETKRSNRDRLKDSTKTISGDLETSFQEKHEADSSTTQEEDTINSIKDKGSVQVTEDYMESVDKNKEQLPVLEAPTKDTATVDEQQQQTQNIFNVVEPPSVAEPEGQIIQETETPSISTEADNPKWEPSVENPIIIQDTTTAPPTNNGDDGSDEQNTGSWTNQPQFGQKLHSESVFLRLSNRIKALERNMTLSGQYLEELSRRYKKQVEDLQGSFAKTLLNIEEQNRRSLERKQELVEQNQKLRDDLEILTDRVFCWKNIFWFCTCFISIQVVIFYTILRFWTRKYFQNNLKCPHVAGTPVNASKKRKSGTVSEKVRRKSAEEKREAHISTQAELQRRPSSEALHITGTYEELLIKDSDSINNIGFEHEEYEKSNKRNTDENKEETHKIRKTGAGTTDNKNPEPVLDDFVRIEDLKQLYTNPPLSDDYEIYGPPDLSSNEFMVDDSESTNDSSQDHIEQQKSKRNNPLLASASAKLKFSKNKNKTRRLSSPTFFKFQNTNRNERSTGWEWRSKKSVNKSSQSNNNNSNSNNNNKEKKRKAKSESPDALKCNGFSNSSNNNNNYNNYFAKFRSSTDSIQTSSPSSIGGDSERKQGGSFRKLLKKMF